MIHRISNVTRPTSKACSPPELPSANENSQRKNVSRNRQRGTNQRTSRWLIRLGYLPGTVETYLHWPGIRRDLFGLFDVIGISPAQGIVGVQSTTAGLLAAHRAKMLANSKLRWCLRSGFRVQLWSWRMVKFPKRKPQWAPRIEEFHLRADEIAIIVLPEELPGTTPEELPPE